MMPPSIARPRRESGFTLVEILLAVGVFALTIIGMIALLTPVTTQVRDIFDSNLANRTIGSIEKELKRIRRGEEQGSPDDTRRGFFFFVGDGLDQNLEADSAVLYVTEDGSRARLSGDTADLDPVTGDPKGIAVEDRYFEVFVRTFDSGDLQYQDGNAYIPLQVTITWPFTTPDGTEVAVEDRQSFTYPTALVAGQ